MESKDLRAIVHEFDSLQTFNEQIEFLKENAGIFKVVLDNDSQRISFKDDLKLDGMEINSKEYYAVIDTLELNDFVGIGYFYCSDGVIALFNYIGIDAEYC